MFKDCSLFKRHYKDEEGMDGQRFIELYRKYFEVVLSGSADYLRQYIEDAFGDFQSYYGKRCPVNIIHFVEMLVQLGESNDERQIVIANAISQYKNMFGLLYKLYKYDDK